MLRARDLNVVAILKHEDGSEEVLRTTNIVTDAGDLYYAQKACGETPTHAFDALHLGTGASTPAKTDDADDFTAVVGSGKVKSATYPKTNDGDVDNTGKGADVVTWKFEYATGEANSAGITEAIIVVGAGALSAGEAVLTHFRFAASFTKSASDTLVIYVNHAPTGV